LLIMYEPEGTLNSNLAPYPGVPVSYTTGL
jgi:hypothetical protein